MDLYTFIIIQHALFLWLSKSIETDTGSNFYMSKKIDLKKNNVHDIYDPWKRILCLGIIIIRLKLDSSMYEWTLWTNKLIIQDQFSLIYLLLVIVLFRLTKSKVKKDIPVVDVSI